MRLGPYGTHPSRILEADAQRPDALELERHLLSDDLPLVLWLEMNGIACGSHGSLLSS